MSEIRRTLPLPSEIMEMIMYLVDCPTLFKVIKGHGMPVSFLGSKKLCCKKHCGNRHRNLALHKHDYCFWAYFQQKKHLPIYRSDVIDHYRALGQNIIDRSSPAGRGFSIITETSVCYFVLKCIEYDNVAIAQLLIPKTRNEIFEIAINNRIQISKEMRKLFTNRFMYGSWTILQSAPYISSEPLEYQKHVLQQYSNGIVVFRFFGDSVQQIKRPNLLSLPAEIIQMIMDNVDCRTLYFAIKQGAIPLSYLGKRKVCCTNITFCMAGHFAEGHEACFWQFGKKTDNEKVGRISNSLGTKKHIYFLPCSYLGLHTNERAYLIARCLENGDQINFHRLVQIGVNEIAINTYVACTFGQMIKKRYYDKTPDSKWLVYQYGKMKFCNRYNTLSIGQIRFLRESTKSKYVIFCY